MGETSSDLPRRQRRTDSGPAVAPKIDTTPSAQLVGTQMIDLLMHVDEKGTWTGSRPPESGHFSIRYIHSSDSGQRLEGAIGLASTFAVFAYDSYSSRSQTVSPSPCAEITITPTRAPLLRVDMRRAITVTESSQHLIDEGLLEPSELTPLGYRAILELIESGARDVDVELIAVSVPDDHNTVVLQWLLMSAGYTRSPDGCYRALLSDLDRPAR